VTDWLVVTVDALALKPTEVEPAATVTEDGTCKAVLLLASVTTVELTAAELRYTEHVSVDGPVNVCVPHETLLSVGVAPWAG
jgi:hypothetical protein